MSITPGNATTFASPGTTDTSVTNSVPSGVVDGDLLLWEFSQGAAGATAPSTPSGWSVWSGVANGTTSRLDIFYRFALSEPASYTASGLTSGRWTGIMSAYKGVDQTTPKDATPTTAASATTPAITTVTPNAYVLGHGKAISATGVTTDTWSSSNGTVHAQVTQLQGAATNDTCGLVYAARPTAGAFTPNTAVSGTNTLQCRITSALRPAQLSADASETTTAGLTSTAAVTRPGAASEAVTATLTSTGVATRPGDGTMAGAVGLTATATVTRGVDATAPVVAGLTAGGTVTRPGDAAAPVVAGLSSDAAVVRPGDAALAAVAGLEGGGVILRPLDAVEALTASLTATAAATRPVDAVQVITATLIASAVVIGNVYFDASRTVAAGLTATAFRVLHPDPAPMAVTATLTSTATATRPGDGAASVTATLTATATVTRYGDAVLTVGVTLEASGQSSLAANAHLAVAALLAATVPTPPERTVTMGPQDRTVLTGAQDRTEYVTGRGPASRTVSAT